MKVAFGSCIKKVAPESRVGEVINDHRKLKEWWVKHYKNLYSTKNIFFDTALDSTPALPNMKELDLSPMEEELSKTIDRESNTLHC